MPPLLLKISVSTFVISIYYWFYYSYINLTRKTKNDSIAFIDGLGAIGIAFSIQLIISFMNVGIASVLSNHSYLVSSVTEEFSKLVFIFIFFKKIKDESSLLDGIYYGIIIGGTFGFVENIFYSIQFSFWQIFLRVITSLPIHLLNGGIIGYSVMRYNFSNPKKFPFLYIFRGLLLSIAFHAVYNKLAHSGDMKLLFLPILLISLFIVVEILIAKSAGAMPIYVLQMINLYLDDYEIVKKFAKQENWLHKEQNLNQDKVPIFLKPTFWKLLFFSFFVLISFSAFTFYYFQDSIVKQIFKIQKYEYISIFIIYPIFISMNFLLTGILNPDFFQERVLQVPILSIVFASNEEYSEASVSYSMHPWGFYCPFTHPEQLTGDLSIEIIINKRVFSNISGNVIWMNEYNASDRTCPSGALITFHEKQWLVYFHFKVFEFIHRYKIVINSFRNKESVGYINLGDANKT